MLVTRRGFAASRHWHNGAETGLSGSGEKNQKPAVRHPTPLRSFCAFYLLPETYRSS
jgi:hypothetical protein